MSGLTQGFSHMYAGLCDRPGVKEMNGIVLSRGCLETKEKQSVTPGAVQARECPSEIKMSS